MALDTWPIALHEAAHAVAGWIVNDHVTTLALDIGPDIPGLAKFGSCPVAEGQDGWRKWVEGRIVIRLAGPLAQQRQDLDPAAVLWSGEHDEPEAHALALIIEAGDETKASALLEVLRGRARQIVADGEWWCCINVVAEELIAKRTMTGEEVRRLISETAGAA